MIAAEGFVPPPYPYDRLDEIKPLADAHEGGCVDLSIGTPCDPPPASVIAALGSSNTERGYPASIGSLAYRKAASAWLSRRFGIAVAPGALAACVGTKEFVALLPQLLHLRNPNRDTILYPAISYPSYEMGAILGGCRAVAVPVDSQWRIDLSRIDEADAERALALWVNTPGNPAGGLDDLDAAAKWGRARGVPVFSDECYIEFTWDGPGRSILRTGVDGVIAVHSLSKRSNLAGARAGFYAGDPELVHYLSEVRKHAGLMVPGPVQAAAIAAFGDDQHVDEQRVRYHERLVRMVGLLSRLGIDAPLPSGGFYLWVPAPGGDAWGLTRLLAERAGMLVSPGEFYGAAGAGHIRIALVQPDDQLDLVEKRIAALT
jgi:succinyldiaminopimelate transaminase